MNLAVVVGGSSGIGYAICQALKDEYQVVNMSRRENDEVENIYCDVESYESVTTAFKELKDKWGIPSIYIHSAGFVNPQHIIEIDYETLIKTFQVNIISAFICTQEFVKICDKSQSNKIIYISSTAGLRPQVGWSAYSSAKSSLISFSNTMSEELKSYNIKTFCIFPARCNTPLRKILCPNEDGSKIMQPEQVSEFVKYLVNNGELLDGQNIIVRKLVD